MMASSNGNIFRVIGLCAGIQRSPVNSLHKGQWRGALMFSLIYAWTNGWVNNREAGYLRRHHAHYNVIGIWRPGNDQFWSKWAIYCTVPSEIWQMTLKYNRTPVLTYFKISASFRSHWWIQNWVTVRTRLIWVQIGKYYCPSTLKFDSSPLKTIGHLLYATSSYVHNFVAICEVKLELQSRNFWDKFVLTSVSLTFDLWPWPLCVDITFIICNNSRQFPDGAMTEILWKRCDR